MASQQRCLVAALLLTFTLLNTAPRPTSAQPVTVTSYSQLREALATAASSPSVSIRISQNVTISKLLVVSTAGEVVIAGKGAPSVIKCRPGSGAFLLREGRLVLRNLVLDGCPASAVAAAGPRSTLALDTITITRSGQAAPTRAPRTAAADAARAVVNGTGGAAPAGVVNGTQGEVNGTLAVAVATAGVVDVTRGAALRVTDCKFIANDGPLLLRVEMVPTSNVTVTDTLFTNNTGGRLVALNNTEAFAFNNITLRAYNARLFTLWTPSPNRTRLPALADPTYDPTRGDMPTVTFTRTTFLRNTLTDEGSLLTANGTRVHLVGCLLDTNQGFGSLLHVDAGMALLDSSTLTNNTGAATGQPALLTIQRGAALSALVNSTVSYNSRTAAVHHYGYTHWFFRTAPESSQAANWTYPTLLNKTVSIDTRWSANDLNRTLQETIYNVQDDKDNWNFFWKDSSFGFRWDLIDAIGTLIFRDRRHNAPLLLHTTTLANNRFLWGGLIARATNIDSCTRIALLSSTFTRNTVTPPPPALYDPAIGYQAPALVTTFHGVATVHRCRFTANTAPHGLHLDQTDATITACTFARNVASPTPPSHPLASLVHLYDTRFALNDTTFEDNEGEVLLDALNNAFTASNVSMVNNTVRVAAARVSKANILYMTGLRLENNKATAGTIMQVNFTVYWRWNDSSFHSNQAATSVLQLLRPYNLYDSMQMSRMAFTDNVVDMRGLEAGNFTEQAASLGGAMLVTGDDSSQWLPLQLTDFQFMRNTLLAPNAWADMVGGGALRVAGPLGSLGVTTSTFEGNSAPSGGAVRISSPAFFSLVNFTRNTAAGPGGAIMAVTGADIKISYCDFSGNTASSGGAIAIIPTAPPAPVSPAGNKPISDFSNNTFVGNTATPAPPTPRVPGDTLPAPTFHGCLPGGGGVLCVEAMGAQQFLLAQGNEYRNNRASWGGLVYVNDMYYRTNEPRQAVELCGSLDTGNNTATEGWGGQVLYLQSGQPGVVGVRCPARGRTCATTPLAPLAGCKGWPPGHVATGPAKMEIIAGVLNSTAPTIRSGTAINATLQFTDTFGRVIAPLPPFPISMDVQPENPRALVIFGRRADPPAAPSNASTAQFPDIYVQPNLYSPNNTAYPLTLLVNSSYPMTAPIMLTIRACDIGERLTDTFSCMPCLDNTFSGDPYLGSCAPCPTGGDCDPGGMLLPKPGFWHSSPGSPQVHRCPLSKACIRNQTALQDFVKRNASAALFRARGNGTYSKSVPDPAALLASTATYRALQCAPGHQGHLCGVCQGPDYGRFSFRCIRCLPRHVNNFLILLAALLLATMLSFTVFSHLRSVGQYRGVPVRFPASFARLISRRNPAAASSRRLPPSESLASSPPTSILKHSTPTPPLQPQATLDSMSSLVNPAPSLPRPPTFAAASAEANNHANGAPAAAAAAGSGAADPTATNGCAPAAPLHRTETGSTTLSGSAQDGDVASDTGRAALSDQRSVGSVSFAPVTATKDVDGPGGGGEGGVLGPRAGGGAPGLPASSSSVRAAKRQATKAKVFLTVAKIFISYVQVVGITRNLQLEWPVVLQRLINGLDFSSSANYISLECSLGGSSLHKAITQTALMVLLPLFAIIVAAMFWAGLAVSGHLGLVDKAPNETALQYFRSRMILTTVQICYYLYPLVTMAVFQIFTWTTIDAAGQDSVTRQYASAAPSYLLSGKFWTQHYDTRCFTGAHRTLTLGLGIPSLVLFAVGFPLASALQLWRLRHKLDSPDTVLLYGFLYEEYQQPYYVWEAVIMLRKACLLVCTVFLRSYGDAIQLLAANLVLAVCVFLQNKHEPFQDARMNSLETLSLFTTQLTLLAFGYFLPSDTAPTSQAARITITSLIAAGNLAVVAYFLLQLLRAARDWLLSSASASFLAPCLKPKADGDQDSKRGAHKGGSVWGRCVRRPAAGATDCEAGGGQRQKQAAGSMPPAEPKQQQVPQDQGHAALGSTTDTPLSAKDQ